MSTKTPKKTTRQVRKHQPRFFERFHWTQRVAHALLLISFALLAITGLPQKFPLAGWAQFTIRLFGGIENTRLIHHTSATILMLLSIYHLLDVGYRLFVRRSRMTMLPGLKDVKDAWQAFRYNLGLSKSRPQMGRYTFEEKMEYWALVWGTIIMGLTGFMMWNPITTTRILPGEIIPAAKAAHGGEALLAVAAIVVWHMYGVHIKRFNRSMWTGMLTEEEMLHEHPIELADIKAGIAGRSVDAKTLYKRKMVYFPIAGILSIVMLLGVYGFIGVEKTAPTTPPEPTTIIYSPQTPTPLPTPTISEGLSLSWDGYVGPLLQQRCGLCHGADSASGLSLITYQDAVSGTPSGPVISPGDSANSLLFISQSKGGHYATLTPDELAKIEEWIEAGAPEN